MSRGNTHDVIVIGAGAAGVGLGVLFEKMGVQDYVILEKDTVASSFKQWPSYTRFISPSFAGNAFNAPDLNAITPDTSPAYTLKTEHPSGVHYAHYLRIVAKHFRLNIAENTEVTKVEKKDDTFIVHTPEQTFKSTYVVWAGGEFQYPNIPSIPGAELCRHSSTIETVEGEEVTIIGGFESGMELAIQLLAQGKKVTIVDAAAPWDVAASDSSIALAPHTLDRLRPYVGTKQLLLISNATIIKITEEPEGYHLHTDQSEVIKASGAPILATGFENLPSLVAPYFTDTEYDSVALTEEDESTMTPGLFLIGPKVQHGGAIFCFIYKFRQRLPIVAETIAQRLGLSTSVPEEYKRTGMYLQDLSCCEDECTC